MSQDVTVRIGAEDTGIAAVFAEAQASITESVETMQVKLEALSGTFEKIQGAFIAFAAVLAGGEAFKEAVEATVHLNTESMALGRQLGISATEASVLKVALNSVFVSQDTLTAAAAKVTQALKKNESAFADLGVATRDQNGNFRGTLDIMMDVNARLLEFKEGTDRNVEGVKIYGRSWSEVSPILKITSDKMDEAKGKAAELGLVVGVESIAQTKAYRSAMNHVHEVLEGIKVAIGNAVLPALTAMGNWMADNGVAILNGFRAGLVSIEVVLSSLWEAVTIWKDAVSGSVVYVVAQFDRLARVIDAIGSGANWSGVKAAWAAGTANIEAESKRMSDAIKEDMASAEKARDDFFEKMSGNQTPTAKAPSGGETSDGGDDKQKSQISALDAALEAKKALYAKDNAAHGQYLEFSLEQEKDYWKNVLATTDLNAADRMKVQENIDKLSVAEGKATYESQLAALKAQETAFKGNLDAKLSLAKEYAAKVEAAQPGTAAAQKAAGDVLVVQRELDAQLLAIAKTAQTAIDNVQLSSLDVAEKVAQDRLSAGKITEQQLIAIERDLENQRLGIRRAALQAQLAAEAEDPDRNPAKLAEINAQLLQLETQHNAQIATLDLKAAAQQRKTWQQTMQIMQSGFETTINKFLTGTSSLTQMFRGLFLNVAEAMAQMVAKNIASMLLQAAVGNTIALKELAQSAVVAAAKAYSAVAGIPYVGPFLAPAAAALAFAGVMALGGSISAEGGYDIPSGVNPVVQTHQREMILPANIADTVRNMASGGGGGGGGGNVINLTVNATDANSFAKQLANQGSVLAKTLQKHMKGTGRLVPTYS